MKIRAATEADIPQIVQILADDKLGSLREDFQEPLPQQYRIAFSKINQDSNQHLVVLEVDQEIIGTAQLTLIPYLTYQGGTRAQVEAVRVKRSHRSKGAGQILFEWMIEKAKEEGAHLIQLTSDKQRPEALKFYEKLGFKSTHEGLKMHF